MGLFGCKEDPWEGKRGFGPRGEKQPQACMVARLGATDYTSRQPRGRWRFRRRHLTLT